MLCCSKKYLPWIIGASIVLGAYAVLFHQPHLMAILPFLFILACPLVHLVMMRGMGKDERHESAHKENCH